MGRVHAKARSHSTVARNAALRPQLAAHSHTQSRLTVRFVPASPQECWPTAAGGSRRNRAFSCPFPIPAVHLKCHLWRNEVHTERLVQHSGETSHDASAGGGGTQVKDTSDYRKERKEKANCAKETEREAIGLAPGGKRRHATCGIHSHTGRLAESRLRVSQRRISRSRWPIRVRQQSCHPA